jgi:hypothetical protein
MARGQSGSAAGVIGDSGGVSAVVIRAAPLCQARKGTPNRGGLVSGDLPFAVFDGTQGGRWPTEGGGKLVLLDATRNPRDFDVLPVHPGPRSWNNCLPRAY